MTEKEFNRFMTHVKKTSEPPFCWLWTASVDTGGYAHLGFNGKTSRAHRVIFEHYNGPTKLDVMHSCDRPNCVNPEHLSAGTALQNMLDAVKKGRGPGQKLKVEQVKEIKNYLSLGVSDRVISKTFGTSRRNVWNIAKGFSWRHV